MISDPDQWLEVYLSKHAVRTRALYWVVLGMALTGLVLLPIVRISLTVQGRGIIRPVSEKTEIKSTESELVSQVFVQEGQQVIKGDTILALRSEILTGKIQFLSNELDRIDQYINDLTGLTGPDTQLPWTDLFKQQYTSFLQNLAEIDGRIYQAGIEEQRGRYLFETDFLSAQEYEGALFKLHMLQEERSILISDQMARWKESLSDFFSERRELQVQLDQAMKEKKLYVVIAPVTGTVEEFRGIYEGSMLYSGETIAILSPESEMIAEVILSARDIGYVCEGHAARIQVDAFNHNQWGFLQGTVTDISNDFVLVDNMPAFLVKCRLNREYLELASGMKGTLRKGMTVNVCFVMAKISLLQLLLQRSDNWINPSRYQDP